MMLTVFFKEALGHHIGKLHDFNILYWFIHSQMVIANISILVLLAYLEPLPILMVIGT